MASNGTDENSQKAEWLALLNEMESAEPPSEKKARNTPRPVAEDRAVSSPKLGGDGTSGGAEDPPAPVSETTEEEKQELRDLEEAEGGARVPDEERTPEETARVQKALSRYDELRKKPSIAKMNSDDLRTWEELSEIMGTVNRAATMIDRYRQDYSALVPGEKFDQVEDNLKEVAAIMLREFHSLRHGKHNKTYDKRNVCTECHAVYLVPLPEGVCDECRSRRRSTGGAY